MTGDTFNLVRFEQAQKDCYQQVITELTRGRKQSHWMWYIFPQLKQLGRSEVSQFYGISSLAEAQAYLNHNMLGTRLKECIGLTNQHGNKRVSDIFGWPDELKFHSCMSLFSIAAEAEDYDGNREIVEDTKQALALFFNGTLDRQTIELLRQHY
ncbi:DUF1810 domain-containing protein [Thalassotalea fusca]